MRADPKKTDMMTAFVGNRFDVRDFGARGDGVAIDTHAIQAAVSEAARVGGAVWLPAGRYLSFSIRLQSGISLVIDDGATLVAADPARHDGAYDPAEPNPFDLYQDFGHSHWHNSLIWGQDIDNVTIEGGGLIDGLGLTREGPGSQWRRQAGEFPLSMRDLPPEVMAELAPDLSAMHGLGNKAIAFKNCRRVTVRGLTIFRGGHFAVLATGVDDLTLDNLTIDSNRDGLDIDGCRRVSITNCRINTPNDDAIVLKSSYALGELRPTEDVDIRDCRVSGFDPGTLIDGTFGRTQQLAPDRDWMTGRIKIGTESNGDFRRIRIRDCHLERSRGLALETVDGGTIEDIHIENVTMTEVTSAPLFLRLGARLRGPDGTAPGAIRRIIVDGVTATRVRPDYCALIVGIEGHLIDGVDLRNIHFSYDGGVAKGEVPADPGDLADAYPEPSMFGMTPAYGLWTRQATNVTLDNVTFTVTAPDERPERRFD